MNLSPFLRVRCLRVVLTRRWWLWYIGCCGRAESVRVRDGGCSLVGGTPGCDPGGRGFESRQSPRFCASCGGRVRRKTPNLVRLVRFGVFCCYGGKKWTLGEGVGYRLTPGLDDTTHLPVDRAVGDVLVLARTK